MKDTIIFDWDGTLHETAALYGAAFRCAYDWLVGEHKAPPRNYSDGEVSIYLGMSAPDMWESFMPDLEPEYKKKASRMIGEKMDSLIKNGKARLYPGCINVLDRLKQEGYDMVILSNCRHSYIMAHRDFFRLDNWFEDYYAAEDFGFIPKEDIFSAVREKHAGDIVVVGDRESDIAVALTHGLKSIGCGYGYGTKGELQGADIVISEITELPAALKKLGFA